MEFLGTKGKWKSTILKNRTFGIALESNIDDVVCEAPSLINGLKNWEANALLISKAPEMLEMLQKISKGWVPFKKEVDQLIKEATNVSVQ